ncbi:MFS family permease [Rhodococcus sp. 27YEA15]
MTDLPRTLSRARMATSVAFGLQGFLLATILTQLPMFRDLFDLDDGLLTVAVVAVSVIAGLGSILAEKLAVRTSSKFTLRTGLTLIAVLGACLGLAPNAALFLILLAVYGIGVGIVDAAANMQAVSIQHAKGTFILSSFHASWSVGAIVGAGFVTATSGLDIWERAPQVCAGLIAAVALAIVGPKLLDRAAAPASGTTVAGAPMLTVPIRAFMLLGLAMALFYAVDFSLGTWSTLYVENVLLSDAGTAALSVVLYQAAALTARLTGDFWVGKFGETMVVRVGALIGVTGMVVVVAAQSPITALLGFLIVGLGLPVIAPICFSAAGRMAPTGQVDAVIARTNLFNYVGTVMGAGFVGLLATFTNLRIGFLVPLAFCVVLVALAPVFAPRRVNTATSDSAS